MSERKGTKALELWCKRLVKDCPDIRIENMTTSWRDGMAFCALVHHFRPDLIDIASLKPENIYENNQLAFSIAEKHLGIPALLDPEDMVESDVPDRLSVLTYLSQFYQRLGHTVTKTTESEAKASSLESPTNTISAPIKFGKTALDKCAACGLPVYLAQRLMVSQKLYHRRCFRCSKCSGHLNPKSFHVDNGSEFLCDSCKNDANMPQLLNNNNDQIGMLAFNDSKCDIDTEKVSEEPVRLKSRPRPQSILERISMFEKNIDKDCIDYKMSESPTKDTITKDTCNVNIKEISNNTLNHVETSLSDLSLKDGNNPNLSIEAKSLNGDIPEKSYKSNVNHLNFLQTQLTTSDNLESLEYSTNITTEGSCDSFHESEKSIEVKNIADDHDTKDFSHEEPIASIEENNVTDDIRLAKSQNNVKEKEASDNINEPPQIIEPEISVPPRRKKNLDKKATLPKTVTLSPKKSEEQDYPDHLNPFDDEDEPEAKKESTNPFGSSDEDDDVPAAPAKPPSFDTSNQETPTKRHIVAHNPFWSDGEEPTSDEDEQHHDDSSKMCRSPLTTSTPNLPSARRKKAPAPPPPAPAGPPPATAVPPPAPLTAPPGILPAISMEDVASNSSYSSYNSSYHDKSCGKLTPKCMKRAAPTPPDSLAPMSGHGSLERGMDLSGPRSLTDSAKKKGPAPGLPLPERREVKLQMTPEELQVQLDLLETQQLGLERQGVMIEQMIRDKCEGDEPCQVAPEEVEDLVIQLCELVNEKNDLFRKQTELMYIRRQQRLEQEQADIEHEIRVIQSRPAVNRIDSDKAREEQLVTRLVEIVRLRDQLVQQLDAERRRETQEDRAIAASIANKRAQRNSSSKSASLKSLDVVTTPKKNKVKDKVKKQLKKAKHTLGYKKKEEDKEKKQEKQK